MKKIDMKAKTCIRVALSAAAIAFSEVSYASDVRLATEIFVTNKVTSVSNYVDKVARDIDTAVTNRIDKLSNYVDRAIGEYKVEPKRIAMFIIPVNYETNGSFTGFELKASTNNFSHSTGTENTRLQFYAQSEVADTGENGWDKMKMYIGTSHLSSYDVRAYTKLPRTLEWSYDLNSVVVLVDASCLVKNPDGDWLREDNEDLMWCYMRNTSGGVEYEYGTDSTLWRPIAPVRWLSRLPNWAVTH